jgi:hypothetical protein
MYGERLSRTLSPQRAIRRLRATDREAHSRQACEEKDRVMDIIAIEVGATVALLVAHFVIIVRNRFTQR